MNDLNLLRAVVAVALLNHISFPGALAAELHVPSEYPTISAAASLAASGDTIYIARGDYYEQLVFVGLTNLTLQGEPGTVLHASDQMTPTLAPHLGPGASYTIIGVLGSSDVTFRGLAFQGNRSRDFYDDNLLCAIVFRGSSGHIEDCVFEGFRGSATADSRAINVQNDLSDSPGISDIVVLDSRFYDNKASLMFFGADSHPHLLRTRFTLHGNTIIGAQPSEDVLSFGVAVRCGVEGLIKENIIINHTSDLGIYANDSSFNTRGFFQPLKPIVLSGNMLSNNAVHLAGIAANDIVITNNVFERKAQALRDWGVTLTGTNMLVADNNFVDAPRGIAFPAGELLQGISRGGVLNARLSNNWFKNVRSPISTNTAVQELQEIDSQLCCFNPILQSTTQPHAETIRTAVRSWHGQSLVIESSTNLKEWTPIQTNHITLPLSNFENAFNPSTPHLFIRTLTQ